MFGNLNKTFIINTISQKNYFLFLIVILCCFQSLVSGCYITNCPWGGKRSLNENSLDETRQCNSCAGGQGTCFGPRICCGPNIGCLIDSKESLACRSEDTKSSTPCAPYGKSCSKLEFGKCATKHLCCNPISCVQDHSCSMDEDILASDDSNSNSNIINNEEGKFIDRKLIKALNYLLKKKQQQQKEANLDLDTK